MPGILEMYNKYVFDFAVCICIQDVPTVTYKQRLDIAVYRNKMLLEKSTFELSYIYMNS